MVRTFEEMFRIATGGHEPHGHQARIARDGLPDVVEAPTGVGKTGIILAWLWRQRSADHKDSTPRRLVYALPQRTLVDQVASQVRAWLKNLGLTDEVALHVVMGSRGENQGEWREDVHQPAIVVGTVDSLVSKALLRGYGIGREIAPIDFALVTNGAHWIIDESPLGPQSTTTLRQLAAFAEHYGTAEPFGLTRMSAAAGDTTWAIRRLQTEPGHYGAIAAAALKHHRPGRVSVVVLNTVEAARRVYRHLRGAPTPSTLLHPHFRGIERAPRLAEVIEHPADRIVVATQVIEAGLDLDLASLITEAAPWPSLMRRAGAGPRTDGAVLWWLPPAQPAPYPRDDVDAARAQLERLEGQTVTGDELLACDVPVTGQRVSVLRRADFLGLWDTSPDPDGAGVDIAPYVRDLRDLDAEVAWATWTPGADGEPDPEVKPPPAEYRCPVPLGDVATLARDRPVWRLDQVAGRWVTVTAPGQTRARPGEVLLVNAADGGYTPETGFDLSATGPVADSPELRTSAEQAAALARVSVGAEDGDAADTASVEPRQWQSLDEHSGQVRDQAEALLGVLAPALPPGAARSAVTAGYLHDVGKAHRIWQDALCALADPEEEKRIADGRPWAKSGGRAGRLEFAGGVSFRHELASLLLIDGPLRDLLAEAPDPDLARYLVLAHHGKLRVQVRDPADLAMPPGSEAGEKTILGLEQGASSDIPPMLGRPATTLTVDLDQFEPGDEESWTPVALALRDRYGPFVLAYLETLVRIADWRASGGRDLPG